MARVAPGVTGDCLQPLAVFGFSGIHNQRPCTVQRGWAEIVAIPRHHIARGIADAAADALDAGVDRLALGRVGRDTREVVAFCRLALEMAAGALPLVEEGAHVSDQIADHRQVAQRPDGQLIFLDNLVDMGAAGPARHAAHRHPPRSPHAHAARVAVSERRIEMALDVGDDVQHRLARKPRHLEGLEAAVSAAAPDRDLQALSYSLVSTNSRWPSASAAVSRPFAVRNMHSRSLSPAWSGESSLRSRPVTSTSMCSDIVRTVRGFAQSLITGRIGLPMT